MSNLKGGLSTKEALSYALQSPNVLEEYVRFSGFDDLCWKNNCRLFILGTG